MLAIVGTTSEARVKTPRATATGTVLGMLAMLCGCESRPADVEPAPVAIMPVVDLTGNAAALPPVPCTPGGPMSSLGAAVLARIDDASSVANSPVPKEALRTDCNELEMLFIDGPQIFGGLRWAISQAEHEVDIAFFAWDEDSHAADQIGLGLEAAADKLTEGKLLVRILVADHNTPGVPSLGETIDGVVGLGRTIDNMYNSLKRWDLNASKVTVQLATAPYEGLGAMHDKYVVVDGRRLFITGANPQKHHNSPDPWHDAGFLVSGPVARSALAAFDGFWNSSNTKEWICKQRTLSRDCQDISNKYGPPTNPTRDWLGVPPAIGHTTILAVGRNADGLPNDDDRNPQNRAWRTVMDEANTNIHVISPNINDDSFRDAVVDAAVRGVNVKVITSKRFNDESYNGPGLKNLQVIGELRQKMWSKRGQSWPLQLCWYSKNGTIPQVGNHPGASHAKYLSVDGKVAIFGSGNMDTQSWNNSHELNLLVDDPSAVAMTEGALFVRDWQKANCSVVELYKGNAATQELVCSEHVRESHSRDFNAQEQCANDAARSYVLHSVPKGRVIRFFDRPSGKLDDDWIEVIAKRDILEKRISTFEDSFEDADVKVQYHRDNGLDGKVSRIEISGTSYGPIADFREGNNGTQNLVCSIRLASNDEDDLSNGSTCANDEARSMLLYSAPKNKVIRVYDSPSGHTDDDWAVIRVREDIGIRTIGTFQQTFVDNSIEMYYFRNNGLDGKISRIEIDTDGSLPRYVSLYEGGSATQNKVCDLRLYDRTINFKEQSSCDNDEARSLVLTLPRAGTSIKLYDDPGCGTSDDWTEIFVKKDLTRYTVNSLESDYENASVKVNHRHDNGLNGKVSCIRIRVP